MLLFIGASIDLILFKDYYEILGLPKNCTSHDVRVAYRKKAKEIHPDVNSSEDAHENFISLTEAYEVLKNPLRKRKYDALYDYHILGIKPHSKYSNSRRRNKYDRSVKRRKNSGNRKGERYADIKDEKFNKKMDKASAWEGFFELLDFLINIFGVLTGF